MKRSKTLLCITGLPGSGKSFLASIAGELGLKIYSMGDIVREEAIKRFGISDKDVVAKLAEDLRREYGEDAVAKLIIERIMEGDDTEYIVIDGVRSPNEIETFRKKFNIIIIGVIASRAVRYIRIIKRGRIDDISSMKEFMEREKKEREFGLERVLYSSDIYFFNENIDKETARKYAKEMFIKILNDEL